MKDINIIRLQNAVFYAYHGVADGEQDLGAKYEVDFEAQLDFREAAKKDSLHETINYENIYEQIKNILCHQNYYLIETIAYKIVDKIFDQFPKLKKISVRVRKYHPPVNGIVEFVESEVVKERED